MACVAVATLSLASGACGSEGGDALLPASTAAPEPTVAPSSTSSPVPTSTSCSATTGQPGDVRDLQRVVAETVARRSAAFEADSIIEIRIESDQATFTLARRGSFDDETLEGIGTLLYDAEPAEARALLGVPDEGFEWRLVDRILWLYNPVPSEPAWLGWDVIEYAEATGSDPTASMDGDVWIATAADAAQSVTAVSIDESTCSAVWELMVDGDALAQLALTGGALRRLFADQSAATGTAARVEVGVDDDGLVSTMQVDLTDWAAAADGAVEELGGEVAAMSITFELVTLDQPDEVLTPCDKPSPYEEPGFPSGLLCPAG